jgi:hypothetical protein
MCSSITNKYINHFNQYELLSETKFLFFITLKKKDFKHCKPKIIKFVNYNKYKNIENWSNFFLLYSPFWNLENSQLGTIVTWHDAYCQQHDEIFKIKFIFDYQMPYPNI